MNQEHFLTELKIQLKPLQPQQVAYILETYRKTFTERIAAGEIDVAISKDLGSPQAIAADILKEFNIQPRGNTDSHDEWQEFTEPSKEGQEHFNYYNGPYQNRTEKPSFFIRFCQIVGILAVNFFFMIWIIFSGLMLLMSFWLVTVILIASPILGLIVLASGSGAFVLFQLSVSLILGGLGLISLAIMLPISRYTFRFLKSYTRWTVNILRGKF